MQVPLRDCVNQLRGHVRTGHYADAFALGQHILHYYPKHIETYTILAQACLETNEIAYAADLFRRVLSADPENVVALTGMALISETQDKYDDALWYFERAYEIQPTNDELRRELLRVRETYYGTATRYELTAGALARIYARQGDYAHAVTEFRRLLRNEGERYDARVALAETLFRLGRADEAAQLAQAIMADAPYSLKPNLILGALWSENSVPEADQFLQRAQALDPENRVARQLLGERLETSAPPHLPAFGTHAATDEQPLEDKPLEAAAPDVETMRAAEILRDVEQAQLGEPTLEPALFGELDALSLVEADIATTPDQTSGPVVTTAHPPQKVSATASNSAAPSPESVPAPEPASELAPTQVKPETETAPPPQTQRTPSQLATRLAKSKTVASEPVTPDAAVPAPAVSAASLALDKTTQPAPTRRTFAAVPKVRPVIRGAAEKLPAWLRLGTMAESASATFEALPPSTADQIAPLRTEPTASSPVLTTSDENQDRPDWLIQAQAAAAQETIVTQPETNLPDWLKPPSSSEPTPQPSAPSSTPTLPDWLREPAPESSPSLTNRPSAYSQEQSSVVALPDWLSESAEPVQETAPPVEDSAVATGWTDTPVSDERAHDETAWHDAVRNAPPPVRADVTPNQPLPDWLNQTKASTPESENAEPIPSVPEKPADALTLIATARERRDNGDLKGALDLYERAMHRRPNHLDLVIAQLQEIVSSESAPSAAHRLLGEALAMAGRFKESLEQYRIAMQK